MSSLSVADLADRASISFAIVSCSCFSAAILSLYLAASSCRKLVCSSTNRLFSRSQSARRSSRSRQKISYRLASLSIFSSWVFFRWENWAACFVSICSMSRARVTADCCLSLMRFSCRVRLAVILVWKMFSIRSSVSSWHMSLERSWCSASRRNSSILWRSILICSVFSSKDFLATNTSSEKLAILANSCPYPVLSWAFKSAYLIRNMQTDPSSLAVKTNLRSLDTFIQVICFE
mmetsp:Transcript_58804/g.70131  ORF Transcript_58804/g.70131 Transcript_58804/m.70131 type:complete len:234 (+) Transcript_58804:1326-2027(+)